MLRQLGTPHPADLTPVVASAEDIAEGHTGLPYEQLDAIRAQEINVRYCGALEKLKAAPGLDVDTKTWADVASDIDLPRTRVKSIFPCSPV